MPAVSSDMRRDVAASTFAYTSSGGALLARLSASARLAGPALGGVGGAAAGEKAPSLVMMSIDNCVSETTEHVRVKHKWGSLCAPVLDGARRQDITSGQQLLL